MGRNVFVHKNMSLGQVARLVKGKALEEHIALMKKVTGLVDAEPLPSMLSEETANEREVEAERVLANEIIAAIPPDIEIELPEDE